MQAAGKKNSKFSPASMLNLSYTAWSKKEKKERKKSNHPYLNKQAGKRMMVNHHLGKKDEIFSSWEKSFMKLTAFPHC